MDVKHSPLWADVRSLPKCRAGEFRYVLVNQAAFSERAVCIRELACFDRQALLGQPLSACHDRATPFLIALPAVVTDGSHARILAELCHEACYASAISIIDAPHSLHFMADAMTARCDARLPDGTEAVLRYFDTRIMAPLVTILTEEQHASFFACASAWWFAGRDGHLVQCDLVTPEPAAAVSGSITFSLTQMAAMTEATLSDGLIDVLLQNHLRALLEIPYPLRHSTIERLVAAARTWGLNDQADLLTYCAVALEAGSGFEQTAPWSELLHRVAMAEISFSEAVSAAQEHVT